MSWPERVLLITAVLANLATTLWTLLRVCQMWKLIKENNNKAQ